MLLPSPKRYGQSFRARKLTSFANRTVNSILGKMAQAHFLSEEERVQEAAAPLSFEVVEAPVLPQEGEDAEAEAERMPPRGAL